MFSGSVDGGAEMSRWAVFAMVAVGAIIAAFTGVDAKAAALEILGAAFALTFHWSQNRSKP